MLQTDNMATGRACLRGAERVLTAPLRAPVGSVARYARECSLGARWVLVGSLGARWLSWVLVGSLGARWLYALATLASAPSGLLATGRACLRGAVRGAPRLAPVVCRSPFRGVAVSAAVCP